jgi:heavy metal translocating P-type ATPase
MISNKNQSLSFSFLYSKDVFIAIITIFLILLHLALKMVFDISPFYQNFPLYLALILGGIPLVFDLVIKIINLQFSSDLLAGISILASVILEQYLAGALVVLMLSGGQALELYVVKRASFLLEALSKRMPNIAHLKSKKETVNIPIEQVEIGNTLIIYPHEICPVDGIILEGRGVMDESYLTGEPFLISKTPGSAVLSGSVNGDSLMTIKAIRKAIDSRYAKIMQVMLESEQKKPQLRRLGDMLGAFYTPLALVIAIVAWALSGEAMRFLAVLVIATPCPLLIAIPVAIISAISLSAKSGIIIKNPVVLEQISKCRTIIFDKTGTLTYGKPTLTKITYFNHLSQNEILILAASAEHYSRHPLSGAIVEAAEKEKLKAKEASHISEKPGEGLSGIIDGHAVLITSRAHLIKEGKNDLINQLPEKVGLECIILIDGNLAAHFHFHDTPRRESHSFIAHLRPAHSFEKIMIVSGDREVEVRFLAEQIGISEVYFGKTPEEKVKIVISEAKKNKVIYLGDGINDAPALAVATVGVAFGQNSEITSEASDVVIMDNSLERVDELLHISYRMRRIAMQSALGGMTLSIIGMIGAALGYLPPVAGAISQEIIDVFAVLNALRVAFPRNKLTDFN